VSASCRRAFVSTFGTTTQHKRLAHLGPVDGADLVEREHMATAQHLISSQFGRPGYQIARLGIRTTDKASDVVTAKPQHGYPGNMPAELRSEIIGLLGFWPWEVKALGELKAFGSMGMPSWHNMLLRALERERRNGLEGTWGYDISRHGKLMDALIKLEAAAETCRAEPALHKDPHADFANTHQKLSQPRNYRRAHIVGPRIIGPRISSIGSSELAQRSRRVPRPIFLASSDRARA